MIRAKKRVMKRVMKRLRRACASEAGFTLLEVLLATLLMTVILAALATVTAQWLPNWNRGIARVQRAERLALATLSRRRPALSVRGLLLAAAGQTPRPQGRRLLPLAYGLSAG